MEKFWRAAAPDLHTSAGHPNAGGGGSPDRADSFPHGKTMTSSKLSGCKAGSKKKNRNKLLKEKNKPCFTLLQYAHANNHPSPEGPAISLPLKLPTKVLCFSCVWKNHLNAPKVPGSTFRSNPAFPCSQHHSWHDVKVNFLCQIRSVPRFPNPLWSGSAPRTFIHRRNARVSFWTWTWDGDTEENKTQEHLLIH